MRAIYITAKVKDESGSFKTRRINLASCFVGYVKLDREALQTLLQLNVMNRHIRPTRLTFFEREITEGRFTLTNQGLGLLITNEGEVVFFDGQHRVTELLAQGAFDTEILLACGLPPDAFKYVDQHARREARDVIKLILQEDVSRQMVAVARLGLEIHEDGRGESYFGGQRQSTHDEIAEWIDEHAAALTMILKALGGRTTQRAGATLALVQYAERYSSAAAKTFADKLKTGDMLRRDDPIFLLRERMIATKNSGGGRHRNSAQVDIFFVTMNACLLHWQGQTVRSLQPAKRWKKAKPAATISALIQQAEADLRTAA